MGMRTFDTVAADQPAEGMRDESPAKSRAKNKAPRIKTTTSGSNAKARSQCK